jgi:hypothetical protein
MKVKVYLLIALAGLWCWAGNQTTAQAQVDQGRIAGTVTDSSNAAIKGATVTVINERTNESRTAATGTDGSFLVTALKPSFYSIRVNADQFAPAEVKSLQLTVGQELRRSFALQVESLTSSVTVTGTAETAIDTSSARLGINVNQREVDDLPLNGRQLSQLYLQAPGALNSGSGTFGDIRFSGRAVEQNAIRFDGIEGSGIVDAAPGVLNGEVPSPFRLQTSLENVQEFRVESNNYPAEYGTGTGGQISVITKSGSNAFHGSVFEYFRNDALDARNTFDTGTNKSTLRMNQFGASIGGPIVKDKLFFFGYYEGYRLRSGINAIEAVPSEAVRNLPVCAAGVTGGFGAGTNNCVNAQIQPLLAGFIGPGTVLLPSPGLDPSLQLALLNSAVRVNENSGGLRLDYHINDRQTFYVRYFRDQGFNDQPEGVTGRRSVITAWPQNAVVNLTSVLTNHVVNEVKVGFNEARTTIVGQAPTIGGVDYSKIAINISGSVANCALPGQGNCSGIAIPGGLVRANSATNGHSQPYTPWTISFIDNLSWISGNHNFKFGGEVRLVRFYTDRIGGSTYTFSNLNSFLANSLQQVQFLGDVSAPSVFNNGFTGNREGSQNLYIGYAQDEFRVRPNLTLNLGLRYEYYTPMTEANNNYVLLDINSGVLQTPSYCYSPNPIVPCSPGAKSFYHAYAGAFGPRIGFAWSPFSSRTSLFGQDRTVLRGGFGIYYGPGQLEDTLQPIESDRVASTVSGGSYCGADPSCPTSPAALTTNFINNPDNRSYQPRAYAPDYTVPERIYQYSASWEQDWGHQLVSTVAYVGSQGRNLFLRNVTNLITAVRMDPTSGKAVVVRQFDIDNGGTNVLHPYAEVDYKTSGGHDSYNALQASLVRRSNSGLTLSGQYTYSKSFGNTAGSNEAQTSADPFSFDYNDGYNAFDVRHTFNVSALYELPFGRNRRYLSGLSGAAESILGNWTLGTIVNARSGLPLDIKIVRPDVVYEGNPGTSVAGMYFNSPQLDQSNNILTTPVINTLGGGASRNVRFPDLIPGVDPYLGSGGYWLNPAAFATPAPGTFGNYERGLLRGPGFTQVDLTVQKRFPIHESVSVDFRAEFFNILNHTNFKNPSTTLNNSLGASFQPGDPYTLATAGTSFSKLSSTAERTVGLGTNRQIQFSLRLNF